MAKTNKAMNVTVIPSNFSIQTVGNEKKLVLTDGFIKQVIGAATDIGNMIRTAQEKIQIAVNLVEAFKQYKEISKNGLCPFVADYFDKDCPRSYGAAGSAERKKVTSNTIFNGVEYMVKKGQAALKQAAERKALMDAGISPEDTDKIKDHNKDVRDAKYSTFERAFCKCMVDFDKHGVTDTTVNNLLVSVLRKKEKDSDDLNATGKKLLNAAVQAVFKSRGQAVKETAKAVVSQVEQMDELKQNVVAAGKRAAAKK